MTPSKLDLTTYRGRDFTRDLQFTNSGGELIDISTWGFKAEVRSTGCQSGTLMATFTISVDTATSTITLTLTDTQTLAIPEGTNYWDLLVTVGTDDQSYITGKVKSKCTVTEVS